jgi:hypothetical protein
MERFREIVTNPVNGYNEFLIPAPGEGLGFIEA